MSARNTHIILALDIISGNERPSEIVAAFYQSAVGRWGLTPTEAKLLLSASKTYGEGLKSLRQQTTTSRSLTTDESRRLEEGIERLKSIQLQVVLQGISTSALERIASPFRRTR